MTSAWKWSAHRCTPTTPCCSVEWSSVMTGARRPVAGPTPTRARTHDRGDELVLLTRPHRLLRRMRLPHDQPTRHAPPTEPVSRRSRHTRLAACSDGGARPTRGAAESRVHRAAGYVRTSLGTAWTIAEVGVAAAAVKSAMTGELPRAVLPNHASDPILSPAAGRRAPTPRGGHGRGAAVAVAWHGCAARWCPEGTASGSLVRRGRHSCRSYVAGLLRRPWWTGTIPRDRVSSRQRRPATGGQAGDRDAGRDGVRRLRRDPAGPQQEPGTVLGVPGHGAVGQPGDGAAARGGADGGNATTPSPRWSGSARTHRWIRIGSP